MDDIDDLYLLRQWLRERVSQGALAIGDACHALLFGWHAFRAEWQLRRECQARFGKALRAADRCHRRRQRHLVKQHTHHRRGAWH